MPTRYLYDEKGNQIKWKYLNGNAVSADEDVFDNISLLCLFGWLKQQGGITRPHIDSTKELTMFYWSFGYKTGTNSALRYVLESEFLETPFAQRFEHYVKNTRNVGIQLTSAGLALGKKTACDILENKFDFIIFPAGNPKGLRNRKNWKHLERALLKPTAENVEKLVIAIRWTYKQATH